MSTEQNNQGNNGGQNNSSKETSLFDTAIMGEGLDTQNQGNQNQQQQNSGENNGSQQSQQQNQQQQQQQQAAPVEYKEGDPFKVGDITYTIDKNGNAVDFKGQVVKTAEEIKALKPVEETAEVVFKEGEKITIGDDDKTLYTIDKDGNAVDAEGKVFKTAEELKALANPDDDSANADVPLVEEVVAKLGFKFLDDKGQPKKFDDTVDGLLEVVKAASEQLNLQAQEELIKQIPAVKDIINFVRSGGNDMREFYKSRLSLWSEQTLDEKNESQLMSVIIADLTAKGHTADEANELAKFYKDKGADELVKKGKAAFESRVKVEKDAEIARDQQIAARIEANNKAEEKYWNDVHSTVMSGKLKDIEIPEADRKGFFDYISKPVDKDYNSQKLIDLAQLDNQTLLQLDYLLYKKFDLKSLIQRAAQTANAEGLKKRIQTNKGSQNPNGKSVVVKKVPASQAEVGLQYMQ